MRVLGRRRNDVDTTEPDDLPDVVERAYRLILGRSPDPDGAAWYVSQLRSGALSLSEMCAALAGSAEFAALLRVDRSSHPTGPHAEADPDRIDVAELVRTVSVETLAERAEGYFRAVGDPELLLSKPFSDLAETPALLVTFGHVIQALRPIRGSTVLDFGAGTCWTSRFLTQLGCRVIALDVSATALELGRRLYQRMPVMGDRPAPEFLVFDGRRIDLPDASVDRVLSFDAFHHVPNPAEVMREMARVLRPGGIAAFSEPGDRHSIQPQSQFEMRTYGIIENDVVIEDVWDWAREAGFVELRLCLLNSDPAWVDVETFQDVIRGREQNDVFDGPTRAGIADRRMFWLRRAGDEVLDSREARGLVAELAIEDLTIGDDRVVTGTCRVRNPGPRRWLPSDAEFGAVQLGVRVHLGDRSTQDLMRVPLPGPGIEAGAGAEFAVRVEVPANAAAVEFDLVSDGVCWFSTGGSPVVRIEME